MLQSNYIIDYDFEQARSEYQQAWQNFNNAESDFIDDAIKFLHAAELKIEAVISRASKIN